jgi:transcriptional regulator GlxA family with amidase domain
VARSVVDLVGTMLAQELGSDAIHDPRRQQLNAILKYIDTNLAVPGLGPAQLALAHHISTRHLHALFRDGGTTVAAWIRQRRLDRCRRMLADPLNADVSIASVAAGSGFTDAAHFSRIFKAAYGESPTELRQRTRLAAAA